jgi:hypothetical protein
MADEIRLEDLDLERMTDAQLVELSERLPPGPLMALVAKLAKRKVRGSQASSQLDIVITVALDRRDVDNRRMTNFSGYRERAQYKRRRQI